MEKNLEQLIQKLQSKDPTVRETALEQIASYGASAIQPLINALKRDHLSEATTALLHLGDVAIAPLVEVVRDTDRWVRYNAVKALGFIEDSKVVLPLMEALRDTDRWVRQAAASALEKLGELSVKPLIEALHHEHVHMRRAAATVLGGLGDNRAVKPLLDLLHDADVWVRRAAAMALGQLGAVEALNPLFEFMTHDNESCEAIAYALAMLGEPAIDPLVKALQNEHYRVRRAAAEALANLWDNDQKRLLSDDPRLLNPMTTLLHDGDSYIRLIAAQTLGNIKAISAVEPLVERLKLDHHADVRQAAAFALGQMGGTAAIRALIGALKDEDWLVRETAVEALGKLRAIEAVPALIGCLEDDNQLVRDHAARALGYLGDEMAIPPLLRILNDDKHMVRVTAVLALEKIGTPAALNGLEVWHQSRQGNVAV